MTIHYHGTPINPRSIFDTLSGHFFCVPFSDGRQLEPAHKIGQGVMLDNGAYTIWRRNSGAYTYTWDQYYEWARPWLDYPNTWAVIPDVIGGTETENDRLICQWFERIGSFRRAAPVWHLHESWDRLERLVRGFDRVCFGSSGDYAVIGSNNWNNRMNEAFNRICAGSGTPPAAIHMLRGMGLSGSIYPFASVDSTDIAKNHHRPQNTAKAMAMRWDAQQNPAAWKEIPLQLELK